MLPADDRAAAISISPGLVSVYNPNVERMLTLLVLLAQLEKLINVVLTQCLQDNNGGALALISQGSICIREKAYLFREGVPKVDECSLRGQSTGNSSLALLGVLALDSSTTARA